MTDAAAPRAHETELSDEAQAVVEKAAKLLAVAAKTTSAPEAAAFSAKAMALLAQYNLDVAVVERASKDGPNGSGKRKQDEVRGGMYEYQRELWRALAQLNFCVYFCVAHSVERSYPRKLADGTRVTGAFWGKEHRHTLVGRVVNVVMTRNIGQYLEVATERLVAERFPLNRQRFCREAVAFREGIAEELVDRLRARRLERKQEEQARAARAAAGGSSEQALTIADVEKREHDANMDELYGEGWSAQQAAERAEKARARKEAEQAWTTWAEANPEEAARMEKAERDRARRSSGRSRGWRYRAPKAPTAREERSSTGYFAQGRDAAAKISLEVQAESRGSRVKGVLTHG